MRYLVVLLLLLLGILQYRLWVGEDSVVGIHHQRKQIEALRQEVEKKRNRNDAIAAEVYDLKHGREAIEERARGELGMILEGETFYQVIEGPPAAATSVPAKPR